MSHTLQFIIMINIIYCINICLSASFLDNPNIISPNQSWPCISEYILFVLCLLIIWWKDTESWWYVDHFTACWWYFPPVLCPMLNTVMVYPTQSIPWQFIFIFNQCIAIKISLFLLYHLPSPPNPILKLFSFCPLMTETSAYWHPDMQICGHQYMVGIGNTSVTWIHITSTHWDVSLTTMVSQ